VAVSGWLIQLNRTGTSCSVWPLSRLPEKLHQLPKDSAAFT